MPMPKMRVSLLQHYITISKESYSLYSQQNVELLLKPLSLHPILAKTIVDKFAAVQILQVYFLLLILCKLDKFLEYYMF